MSYLKLLGICVVWLVGATILLTGKVFYFGLVMPLVTLSRGCFAVCDRIIESDWALNHTYKKICMETLFKEKPDES